MWQCEGDPKFQVIFDPSASATLGDRVPYERRGLVMGINELGWSVAGLIGVPLMARAIEVWGWQSPFALIALGGVMVFLWSVIGLPKSNPHPQPLSPCVTSRRAGRFALTRSARSDKSGEGSRGSGVRSVFATIAQHRSAVLMLLVTAAFMVAAEMIGVTYATWLERTFAVDVVTLGNIVAVFAIADVVGELLSMWGVDRFGKKRALLVGFVGTTVLYFIIPALGATLIMAVAGLFVYYVCFEFTIVSIYPLISELVPAARATLLSLTAMASNIGRMVGGLGGALLFTQFGFGAIGIVAGLLVGAAVVLFAWGVKEGKGI